MIAVVLVLAAVSTRGWWLRWIGQSLVCARDVASGDVLLVENFDPDYLLFERAAALQRAGHPARVLVPTRTESPESGEANLVARGIVELMAGVARVQNLEIIPVREIEPYSLTAARQVRDHLVRERVRSVVVLSPALRSRRSSLVFQAVLGPVGIRAHCLPVWGPHTPDNWTMSWHGIQVVVAQFIKLQFYRFVVVIR